MISGREDMSSLYARPKSSEDIARHEYLKRVHSGEELTDEEKASQRKVFRGAMYVLCAAALAVTAVAWTGIAKIVNKESQQERTPAVEKTSDYSRPSGQISYGQKQ